MPSSTLYWLIIGCEISFWVVLFLGLAARYAFGRKRLSVVLLLGLPVLDLALLAFTALDLASGTKATFAHGLAAAYVGFTIAFGSVAVSWADQRFAHWLANGPAPSTAPTRGLPALRYELLLWVRCLAAVAITFGLLVVLIAVVDDRTATEALYEWFRIGFGCAIVWFVFGPLWTLLFSSWRQGKTPDESQERTEHPISWRQASDLMRTALKTSVVPELKSRGFRGSFPHLYRVRDTRIDLLTFQFSQFGPSVYIEIASCAASAMTDGEATVVPPSKLRRHHAGLYFRRIGPMPSLDFENITSLEDAKHQVEQTLRAINIEGESWWRSPTPVMPPDKSSEQARGE